MMRRSPAVSTLLSRIAPVPIVLVPIALAAMAVKSDRHPSCGNRSNVRSRTRRGVPSRCGASQSAVTVAPAARASITRARPT